METRKPNRRQLMFIVEYLVDLSATNAAIRAGYSAKTARWIGMELLNKPHIAEEIQRRMDKRASRVEITADKVLGEIGKLAFADIRKLFDENGRLLHVVDLPDEIAASVSSVKMVVSRAPGAKDPAEVEHTAEIKFWDKRGSLELLGRHLKLFTDKVEHSGDVGLADLIKGARERSQ